uniref:Uncharacterized protein n=1 Tax=Tanacetum cinerariifolium TaxID=118510 RepID=A0A6L2NCY6_TANCI|nr:hypothetical protein [Tanacetum cinerariifolium]
MPGRQMGAFLQIHGGSDSLRTGKLIQKLLLNQEVYGLPSLCLLQYFSYKESIVKSLDDMIIGRKDGSSRTTYSKLSARGLSSRSVGDSKFSSKVIAMNALNLEKISSSRRVPSMELRILLPSSRRASKSSSKILSITSILKQVSSLDVKKRSSQDERNFAIFFHFEDNEIGRKGSSSSSSLSKLIGVSFCWSFGLSGGSYDLPLLVNMAFTCSL